MVSRRKLLAGMAAAALARATRVDLWHRDAVPMLLVPMDDDQQNHLKAYGLTYNTLKAGGKGEWLLNYKGGSFLLPDLPEVRRRAALAGVTATPIAEADLEAEI